jgi:5-methylcytosine-specific restriction endonuclease McrA
MTATPYRHPMWPTVRLRILQRDGYACQLKLPKCRGKARAVDHIIDWRDGGGWFDATNLRAACIPCNTAQRNSRVAERARAQREGVRRTDLTW